jgi:hypothetical protein
MTGTLCNSPALLWCYGIAWKCRHGMISTPRCLKPWEKTKHCHNICKICFRRKYQHFITYLTERHFEVRASIKLGHVLWSIKMFILACFPHTSETFLVFLLHLTIGILNNSIVRYTSSSTIWHIWDCTSCSLVNLTEMWQWTKKST